jgi:4-hydroxy-2-oxoheptanedioate aldolase
MIKNILRTKLEDGQTVYGSFFNFSDPALAEFVANLGWDFLIFDGEHGSVTPGDVGNLSRACELHGVTPLARSPGTEPHLVNRFLDAGAHGVVFPMIENRERALEAVRAVKYPPRGRRGLGVARPSNFLTAISAEDFIPYANEETMVITQVETQAAVDTLDEVLALEGIDVVFVGPLDLSIDLGFPGQFDHPQVKDVIERVARRVVASGKVFGTFAPTSERARYVRDQLGARFIATGLCASISDGCRTFLDGVRG